LYTLYHRLQTSMTIARALKDYSTSAEHFMLIFIFTFPPTLYIPSTDDEAVITWETVQRNLQVKRCRSLPCATGDIVVRTVARAEPASKVTSLANRHTTQMRAHTDHDQPLRLLDTVLIWLWVTERLPLGFPCFVDFRFGAVADEDGLAAPFDDDLEYASDVAWKRERLLRNLRSCPPG